MRTLVIIVILGAAIGGFLAAAHSGSIYFTGKDWYENCWTKANSDILAKPKSAEQSAAWWQCESSIQKAMLQNGLINADHTGDKPGVPDPVIAQMCLTDKDKPDRGWFIQYVEHIEIGRGGLSFLEQILPASMMLDRIVAETFEGCNKARIAGSYPKQTFGNRGDWVWTEPCKRCQGAVAKQ